MVLLQPIPPKPPQYATLLYLVRRRSDVLPTAIPSYNSLFESSTDKPATATIDSNIENNNDDLHIMYPTTMIIIIMQTLTNSQVPQQISHQPNTCHQS